MQGVKSTPEGCWPAGKPHPHLSQPVTNACHNNSLPAQFDMSSISDKATPALSGANNLSHDSSPLGQKESTHLDNSSQSGSPKETSKKTGQIKAKDMERVSLGCQESFTSLSTGTNDVRHLPPTCGHLLAHPLLVNAIQKEVQKETQMKNPPAQVSHSRDSQIPRPLSEPKRHGTTKYSVLNQPCVTISSCYIDPNQTINNTPASICPNQTLIPICTSTVHHNLTEPSAPQCHLGGSYLEEEESSSSSDDEGKLVIELE